MTDTSQIPTDTTATDAASTDAVTVEDIEALHRALLPDEKHHGLRRVQNWIGGSSWHPLSATSSPRRQSWSGR